MLTNTSQMLMRNIADLTGNILIVEPEADELCRSLLANLPTAATLSCYTTNAVVASTWQHSYPQPPDYQACALPLCHIYSPELE